MRIGTDSSFLDVFDNRVDGHGRDHVPIRIFPVGVMVFALAIAFTTSSGDMLNAASLSALSAYDNRRALPPIYGGGADTPGNVAKSGRTRLSAASCRLRDGVVVAGKNQSATGTLPASKRIHERRNGARRHDRAAPLTLRDGFASACAMSVPDGIAV